LSRKRNSQITKISVILLSQNGMLCVQIRIKDICEETGIKVDFKSTKAGFVSIFHRPENFDETSKVGEDTESCGQSSGESGVQLSGQSGRESGRESSTESGTESGGQSGRESSRESSRESGRESTSHSIDQQILKLCSKEDLSFSEIISKLGYSHNNPYVHNRVVALRKLGLLEYTIPEKPNSRLQRYRLVKK